MSRVWYGPAEYLPELACDTETGWLQLIRFAEHKRKYLTIDKYFDCLHSEQFKVKTNQFNWKQAGAELGQAQYKIG